MKTQRETSGSETYPPKAQEAEETYAYDSPNNYYHNDNYTAPGQNQGHRLFNGQGSNWQFRGFTQRSTGQRPQYNQCQFQNYRFERGAYQQNRTQYGIHCKPFFQGSQTNNYRAKAMAGVLSKLEDVVMVGPITRVTMALTNISIIHMISR